MGAVPTLPQVADITPTASAAGGVATSSDIGALMSPIINAANAPLPSPYARGTEVAEPHLKNQVPYTPVQKEQPMNNQATSIRIARHQNAVAGLANMIGQAGQKIQEKKQADLKDKLVDVMKAKQNVANAQQILNDPNADPTSKKLAQNVMMANKKQLDQILSDPKHQKQLAKALDISYVDPEKNKTPEVAAFKQATEEFKKAGVFNADNPQEHKVAEMASAPKPDPNAPKLPAPTMPQVTKAAATPYADAALKKDLPSIESNPQYEQATKQQAAAQKQLSAMIPHLIDAESKAQLQAVKDNNAGAREVYKASADFRTKAMEGLLKLQGIEAQDKTKLQATAMRDSTMLAQTQMRVAATLKVAEMNNLTKEQQMQVKQTTAVDIDKQINATEATLKSYGQRQSDVDHIKDKAAKEKAQKSLDYSREQDQNKLKILQDSKAKLLGLDNPTETKPEPEKPGIISQMISGVESLFGSKKEGTSNGDGSSNKSKPESVGSDQSDESDNSDEDNSDNYGHD